MTKTVHGRVHGNTIELEENLGVAEGQKVEVRVITIDQRTNWGEGIRRTAGALADDPHWDAIMEQIQQARKLQRRGQDDVQ
jgi:hypothetical protein